VTEAAGDRAGSIREILARALDPEIQVRIREAVRDSYEAEDPVWRKLIREADVVLDGQSLIVLDSSSVPYEKNLSDLREEAIQFITRAGRVGLIMNFAQEITTSPTSAHVLDQAATGLRDAGGSRTDPALLLVIVLILLLAGVLPLLQGALPAREQALITNEEASLGLALAVVGVIKGRK
jgi:hypothetical protein